MTRPKGLIKVINFWMKIALDQMLTYEAKYCHCVQHLNRGPWCEKWNNVPFAYCVLFGELESKFCPGAQLDIDVYYTTQQSICNKSESKFIHH